MTLAMLAFDARVYPSKELGMVVHFVPIQMPAQYVLMVIGAMSILGVLGAGGRANVAHATHLGGLVFGVTYYEMLSRGWLTRYRPGVLRLNSLKRMIRPAQKR